MANEVQIPLDPNPLGPMEPIFFTGTITPLSQVYANFVRSKLFGKHVREALARGILIASIDANEAKDIARIANVKSDETAERQDNLEECWNAVVSETTDGAEVIEARVDTEGVRQTSLSARLLKDFTDRLTKAQLIKFLAGEDIEVTVTSDFNTPPKVMGSIVENGNIARCYVGAAIPPSPPTGFEYGTQAAYDAIKKLEGTLSTQSTNTGVNASVPWHVIQFNGLWILEKNFPSIFKNATTTAEKVAIVKNKISAMTYTINGKGSGPSSTSTTMAVWQNTIWTGNVTKTGTTIQEFKQTPSQYSNKIDANGLVNLIFYSTASDGTVTSSVSIDYTSIDLTVKFNISDFVATKAQHEELKAYVDAKDSQIASLISSKTKPILNEIKFIGHRGMSYDAPENSTPAFQLTGSSKAAFWGCETDVRLTKDGIWVCMHDDTIDRTTNGTGKVSELTLAQIQSYKIDTGNNLSFWDKTTLIVPTLEEYLRVCRNAKVIPVIELKAATKAADYDSFMSVIKKMGFESKAVVLSDYVNLVELRKRSEVINFHLATTGISTTTINQAIALRNCAITAQNTTLTQALVEQAHEAGLEVSTWTVNDIPSTELATWYGVDYITTDAGAGRFINRSKTFTLRKEANAAMTSHNRYASETPKLTWDTTLNETRVSFDYPFYDDLNFGATAYLSTHTATKDAGYTFSTHGEDPNGFYLVCYKNNVKFNPLTTNSENFWISILVEAF
ncbi:glycerophosphoryl diester phosphodiesterase family protein [Carnobacterium maltaromaticum LMA28]|uniref:Glycerophosphoryl diester phosphodiesterase family protein n=1 Tax=Carnobacterium maltaromaticum LMA28 TaxID=1234679 RepID=K8E734_CARML|nr:glycerophosphodiester phosphodiesterase family protein [Carnobacterium maltaromaticum]CCO12697.2 glycerophosphoryl diester phosphodiesterase family protein [Carnobacterium maltaromaticum LMA28]